MDEHEIQIITTSAFRIDVELEHRLAIDSLVEGAVHLAEVLTKMGVQELRIAVDEGSPDGYELQIGQHEGHQTMICSDADKYGSFLIDQSARAVYHLVGEKWVRVDAEMCALPILNEAAIQQVIALGKVSQL